VLKDAVHRKDKGFSAHQKSDTYNRDVPLHMHPDAGRLHTSGKTLSDSNVLLMPNIGQKIDFDDEGFEVFIHQDRLVFVQGE
jgi:hypothetical protein